MKIWHFLVNWTKCRLETTGFPSLTLWSLHQLNCQTAACLHQCVFISPGEEETENDLSWLEMMTSTEVSLGRPGLLLVLHLAAAAPLSRSTLVGPALFLFGRERLMHYSAFQDGSAAVNSWSLGSRSSTLVSFPFINPCRPKALLSLSFQCVFPVPLYRQQS